MIFRSIEIFVFSILEFYNFWFIEFPKFRNTYFRINTDSVRCVVGVRYQAITQVKQPFAGQSQSGGPSQIGKVGAKCCIARLPGGDTVAILVSLLFRSRSLYSAPLPAACQRSCFRSHRQHCQFPCVQGIRGAQKRVAPPKLQRYVVVSFAFMLSRSKCVSLALPRAPLKLSLLHSMVFHTTLKAIAFLFLLE